ncbi:MAG: aminotransferase class III-fold pyridoxal phosphate-dependent enzyme [Alphaproteobacteria bacterium]|nr:aminotransferase class III-fold pyridoxal phosphate-dependent enzyme [Alphaproteobacteria bacterium]
MTFMPNSQAARDIASYIHPQTNPRTHQETGPTVIAKGDGIWIEDSDGNRVLDAAAGLWCASLGFSANERLARVAYNQMRKLGYYQTYRSSSNDPTIDLTEKLLKLAPVPMSKVLLQCSGSEANDTAIKLIWYYQHAVGKPDKKKIIGRMAGYHGNTVAAASLSGKPDMHADFGIPLPMMRHTEFPHYYRNHQEGESEEAFATRMAEALDKLIVEEGPETVAAFFAEPVMGAGGAVLPPKTYFQKIQAVLRKHDVLFVADEVICGFGRTGNWWGSQTYDLKPDLLSCAKALSAAFQPISALLISEKIYQAMLIQGDKQGNFSHGYTYSGHPVATAVALEALKIYEETEIVGHVQSVGPRLIAGLRALADHPIVGQADGVGLIAGLELVADKKSRKPFPAEAKITNVTDQCARKHGLVVRVIGNRIALSPPLIITDAEVDELLLRLRRTLDDIELALRKQ